MFGENIRRQYIKNRTAQTNNNNNNNNNNKIIIIIMIPWDIYF